MVKKVTIKDVALEAGVSYATVSRALNGLSEVNSETRLRVLEAAQSIGYVPNGIARSLVSRKSNTIALVLPEISNTFFADLAMSLEDAAMSQGYNTLLCNTRWDPDIQNRVLNMVEEKCVDGVIIKPVDYNPERIENISVPTVLLNHTVPEEFSQVEVENEKGGFMGCEHLILSGYKRISFVGGAKSSLSNTERLQGYKNALKKYGMKFNTSLVRYGGFDVKSGYVSASSLLSKANPPDAFMCGNDMIALGVWQRVVEQNLNVPNEIGICGFDNVSIAGLPQIQLTSVNQPRELMGEYSAKILINMIDQQGSISSIQKVILEPTLIKRSSTRDF